MIIKKVQYVKADKSTLEKVFETRTGAIALTTAGGKQFKQDTQRLKKSFS